jgi:hypothetical protein
MDGANSTLSDIIKFDMWVDNDVPNWFLTSKMFYRSPYSKWSLQYRTNSTLSDFNAISYVGRLWCPKLIPDIEKFLPFPIFKMATTIPHKFNIGRFQHFIWCPELIPDIEKILPFPIFKMVTTIPHKFNIVRVKRPELIPDIGNFYRSPFSKWPPQYHKISTLFDFKGSF